MHRRNHVRLLVGIVLTFFFSGALVAYAGSLTPSASPAATMNTVAEIYDAVASTTFSSSAITASSTGSLIQVLKNIATNLSWSVSSNNLTNTNTGTVAIDSSDWDISTTGAITGVAFDANGTGNTLTNVDNADLTADTLDFTAIADSASLDADTAIAAGAAEELTYTKAYTNATTEDGLVMSFTASDTTSSTTAQYGLYLDNVASTEGADALLVIDNSDLDDAVGAAIKFINAGGAFTALFDIAGTLLSPTEVTILDSGIALSELTDSGTLTAGTVDINGGAIDGTTIGATSAGAGTFTAIVGTSLDLNGALDLDVAALGATITNTADAASSQVAIFEGDRATPADADAAYATLRLSDSAGNQDEQARISWAATTVADGATQDGDMFFSALTNNTLTEYLRIVGATGAVEANTAFRFGFSDANAGAATTYWIGRDTGNPNQLKFNVPTDAGFVWSENNTALMTLSKDGALTMANDSTILFDVNTGLTASTTQTQGNGALTADVNQVTTVTNANDTVTLPAAVAGRTVVIVNVGANIMKVFPASGDDAGAGVNAAITPASSTKTECHAIDTTVWACTEVALVTT
ncbi:MAG: hypothetical protein Q7S96_01735 [bacterium]|nr:hypothetical protein [bacterium]